MEDLEAQPLGSRVTSDVLCSSQPPKKDGMSLMHINDSVKMS
jgi:hypothetical protein